MKKLALLNCLFGLSEKILSTYKRYRKDERSWGRRPAASPPSNGRQSRLARPGLRMAEALQGCIFTSFKLLSATSSVPVHYPLQLLRILCRDHDSSGAGPLAVPLPKIKTYVFSLGDLKGCISKFPAERQSFCERHNMFCILVGKYPPPILACMTLYQSWRPWVVRRKILPSRSWEMVMVR
jgi:hypothetical protein